MKPENIIMHEKIKRKLVETVVPVLSQVVEEGIREGIFHCDNIPERVKMLLIVSNETFDDREFTKNDVTVFVDMTEKIDRIHYPDIINITDAIQGIFDV